MRLQMQATAILIDAGSHYICSSVIIIDSVLKKDENYYPQVFSKEYKYTEKEKMNQYVTSYLKFSSDYSDKSTEE